jgi:hypothetical protein
MVGHLGKLIQNAGVEKTLTVATEHCLEILRQFFICEADTTPIFYRRNQAGKLKAQTNVTRVCRNYDRIKEWALEHRAQVPGYLTALFTGKFVSKM